MKITRHAEIRGMERFGWDCAKLKRNAELSLTDGMYVFFDDILSVIFEGCKYKGGLIYYHEGAVFVFYEDLLLTVYPINERGRK